MKIHKRLLLITALPLFAFAVAHKFYVSVTNVSYSQKDTALQITSRIFIDDFEAVLEERYGFETNLASENESNEADAFIEKYIHAKFLVEIDGAQASYTFIGKEYDADVVICYIEVPGVDMANLKSIQIENEMLTDIFEEQQNIIHYNIDNKKKSFVLTKSDTKGMLNLKQAINKS